MTADREAVVSYLRACLLSSKGDIALEVLKKDFRSIVGSAIPFRDLGYSSVEDFIRSIKGIFVRKAPSGEIFVNVAPSENSEHIASLVNRQKSSSNRRGAPGRFGYGRKPSSQTRYRSHSSSKPQRNTSQRYTSQIDTTQTYKSQRNPPQRNQLYITINNDRQWSHNEPSRFVSERPKPHVEARNIVKHKYEMPPRLKKLNGNYAAHVSINEHPFYNTDANGYNDAAALHTDFEKNCDINDLNDLTNLDLYQTGLEQKSKRTIVTPYNPGYAVAAGRAETQNRAVKELEDKYSAKNNYNEPKKTKEIYSVKRMDTASRNGVRSNIGDTCSKETYISKLLTYCFKRDWTEPVYKLIPRYLKHNRVIYGCQVKVGHDLHFTSYPDESDQPEDAKQFAAKNALEKLIEADADESINEFPVTTDLSLIESRVLQLVEKHEAGLWATGIQDVYKHRFNEQLPHDWLKMDTTFSKIVLTRICDGKVIVCPKIVSVETHHKYVEAQIPGRHPTPNISNPVVCPDDKWDVLVTHVVTTNEIWVRIIGKQYSEKFESLSYEMKLYYAKEMFNMESPPHDLRVEGYYAARIGDKYSANESWHRICVNEVNREENTVEVWFIDSGECGSIDLTQIYQLVDKFLYLPRQAVLCALAGFDHYEGEDDTVLDLMDELLLGCVLVAQVFKRDASKNKHSLFFYKTSDDNKNINDEVINRVVLSSKPQLPEKDRVKEVYVSYIKGNRKLHVQVQSDAFFNLQKIIENLSVDEIRKHCFQLPKDVINSKIYLAKTYTGEWCRAITSRMMLSDNVVEVHLVDYGRGDVVNVSDISNLEAMSSVLARIPPQALPVMLHDVESDSFDLMHMRKLISDTDSVLLKVITSGNVPTVELFKRASEPKGSGALISINNSLKYNAATLKRQSSLKKSSSLTRLITPIVLRPDSPLPSFTSTVTMNLSRPTMPAVGKDFFNIFVTIAANPSNFVVQPLDDSIDLKKLVTKMKLFYSDKESKNLVVSENLVEGGLYAALCDNNEWYRVTLSSVFGELLSVRTCDFGEYTVVSTENLRYLAPQFTELPYQGIRAKLTGIIPMHTDWLFEDCLRFQQLVVEKQFVSIVMETGPDDTNASETVVGLKIIDTSTEKDILIAEILSEENRAILVNTDSDK